MRKLSSATTLSGCRHRIWYFFYAFFLLLYDKAKIFENKTNEKLLFSLDPAKKTPNRTLASENLWATERETNFLFYWIEKFKDRNKNINFHEKESGKIQPVRCCERKMRNSSKKEKLKRERTKVFHRNFPSLSCFDLYGKNFPAFCVVRKYWWKNLLLTFLSHCPRISSEIFQNNSYQRVSRKSRTNGFTNINNHHEFFREKPTKPTNPLRNKHSSNKILPKKRKKKAAINYDIFTEIFKEE